MSYCDMVNGRIQDVSMTLGLNHPCECLLRMCVLWRCIARPCMHAQLASCALHHLRDAHYAACIQS